MLKAEQAMTFIGLVCMIDPPRPEVREAVVTAKSAGIRPVKIAGDHPLTARQITWELDIATDSQPQTVRIWLEWQWAIWRKSLYR